MQVLVGLVISVPILQVFDLQYASPATISRCGMVYVDPKNLGYKPYWQKWLAARSNKQEREDLNRFYEKYVPPLIDMVVEGIQDGKQGEKLKTIVPLTNLNMVCYSAMPTSMFSAAKTNKQTNKPVSCVNDKLLTDSNC